MNNPRDSFDRPLKMRFIDVCFWRGTLSVKELDLVRIKGKEQAVKVYELIDGERKAYIDLFEDGLHLYQNGDFSSAREKFLESLRMNPEDKASQLFLKRCDDLKRALPEEWDMGF